MAQTTYSQIDTVRQQELAHRKDVEKKRQESEHSKLEQAYRIEKERFEAEWRQKMEDVEVGEHATLPHVPPPALAVLHAASCSGEMRTEVRGVGRASPDRPAGS